MMVRAIRINSAKTAVEALPASTRMNSRSGAGQPMPSEVMSIRARIAALAASEIPAPARIRPSCR